MSAKKKIRSALRRDDIAGAVRELDECKGSFAVEYVLRLLLDKNLGYTVQRLYDDIRKVHNPEPATLVTYTTLNEDEDVEDIDWNKVGHWDDRDAAEANAHDLNGGRLLKVTATITKIEELEVDR
jgi:hypothetical protein